MQINATTTERKTFHVLRANFPDADLFYNYVQHKSEINKHPHGIDISGYENCSLVFI